MVNPLSSWGGRVTRESKLPGLAEWARVRDWRVGQLDKLPNVAIYRESAMSAAEVREMGFNRVVLATGSRWRKDGYGRTNVPGVFAIGDVAGPPMLAHKAEHEGVICVEKIKGLDVHPMKKEQIPGCTYCHPQVASVGLTEAKAKEQGRELKVGKFPFIGNGKAIALGEADGFVKTVFDAKTGELLGAHMIGAEVTELIQGYVIARQLETTEHELMETVFAHPTLSEMMHESTLSAYGRALHF